jgi:hypothetical protein
LIYTTANPSKYAAPNAVLASNNEGHPAKSRNCSTEWILPGLNGELKQNARPVKTPMEYQGEEEQSRGNLFLCSRKLIPVFCPISSPPVIFSHQQK